jgi:hypothetical protein
MHCCLRVGACLVQRLYVCLVPLPANPKLSSHAESQQHVAARHGDWMYRTCDVRLQQASRVVCASEGSWTGCSSCTCSYDRCMHACKLHA